MQTFNKSKKLKSKRISNWMWIIVLSVVFSSISISPSLATPEAKRILSLVDYIWGDYKNAVQNKEIINQAEYNEMLEFSSTALSLLEQLKASAGDKAKIEPDLSDLRNLIENKSSVEEVEDVSKDIKQKLIFTYKIEPYPTNRPSLNAGRTIYAKNCSQCHGISGAGGGALASNLIPPPAKFSDAESTEGLSPFKVYNTMEYGIEGTAMPSFPKLSEQEKWDTAFYVLSLRFSEKEIERGKEIFATSDIPQNKKDFKTLATLSNREIKQDINSRLESDEAAKKVLAYLRSGAHEEKPKENYLAFTAFTLSEAVKLYKAGKQDEAYNKALDSYLEGYENVERDLALHDRDLMFEIEVKISDLRNAIKQGKPAEKVEAIYRNIQTDLNRASVILKDGEPAGKWVSFINSLAIILREGLEAVLIVAAVIALLSASGGGQYIRYIHLGWILALVAGLLTWFAAQTLISITNAEREIIEGATSLIAAAVLFYVSYWLISKIEVQKWKEFIKDKVEKAVSKKSVLALASVSFFAVYREAFETVLFYQALWLQAENAHDAVIWGAVAGVAILLVLVVMIFKLSLRIPLKYFFSVTSFFLYFLCFILLGQGIREFQEAGVVGITPVEFLPQMDVLGIYPTLETSLPQLALIIAFIGAVLWLGVIKREREKKEIAVSVSRISEDMKSMHEAFEHIKGHITEWKRCEDIDLEAQELDRQIQDVITHVEELESRLEDFHDVVRKNREPSS